VAGFVATSSDSTTDEYVSRIFNTDPNELMCVMSLKEGLPTESEQSAETERRMDSESLPPTSEPPATGLRGKLARFSREWSRRYVEMRVEARE